MKRFTIFAVLTVLLMATAAPAETAHNLLKRHDRVVAPYALSAIPTNWRVDPTIWFVNSAATNAYDRSDGFHGQTWETPFATLAYAESVLPSAGGVIVLAPTHSETIATSFTLDVDDTIVYSLGTGDLRATFTFAGSDINDVNMAVTGDNSGFRNCRFINGYEADDDAQDTGLATMVVLAGKYTLLQDCYFGEGGDDGDANGVTAVTIGAGNADNDADYATIDNCTFYLPTATNWEQAIDFAKDFKFVRITNNRIWGDFSEAGIDIPAAANAQVGLVIAYNEVTNTEADDHAIQVNGTGSRGIAYGNVWHTNAAATAVDAGGIALTWNKTALYGTDQNFDEDPNGLPNSQ